MRRLLVLSLALAFSAFGAAPVISQVNWSTPSSTSIIAFWVTDVSSSHAIRWGTLSGSLDHLDTDVCWISTADPGSCPQTMHNWSTSGMPPATALFAKVCSSNASGETCSAEHAFTTDSNVSYTPAAPIPVDAPVLPTGTVRTVGANCDDPTTGLVALWTASGWGDIVEIDPAITAKCDGRYIFPAKTADGNSPHRYILTRVKGADANLRTRKVTPSDKSLMARFIHTGASVSLNGSADFTGESCFAGGLRWRQSQGSTWQMFKCSNVQLKTIASIPSSGTLDITVTAHGYTTDHMVHVSGVTGAGAAAVNGDWYIAVVDANTLRLREHIGSVVKIATGAATGGSIWLNQYVLESVTEWTLALPATCTWGTWAHKTAGTGAEDEYHRAWYCGATNTWMQYRMDPNQNSGWPMIDLTTNKAHNLMFRGLSMEPLPMKADPLREQYNYQVAHTASGYLFPQFVTQSVYVNHIYWDQILAVCDDPSRTGIIVGCQSWANPFDGNHIKVSRGYFAGFQTPATGYGMSDDSAVVFAMFTNTGPTEFSDNYIACAGICVYWPDDTASTSSASDLTFVRNTIERPDKYYQQSPQWLGLNFSGSDFPYYSNRHGFETKRMVRADINGNVFIGGWVFNNSAAAICLCSRGGGTGALISSVAADTITTYDANVTSSWVIPDLHVGDKVYLHSLGGGTCTAAPQQVYTVASTPSLYSATLSPSPACTATTGRIVRIFAHTNRNSDYNVRNNTFKNSPTGVSIIGGDDHGDAAHGNADWISERMSFTNNAGAFDQGRVGYGSCWGNAAVCPSGHFVVVNRGIGFLTLEHNAVYPRQSAGGQVVFLNMTQQPGYGLRLRYNVAQNDATSDPFVAAYSFGLGSAAITGIFGASATVTNNGWLRPGGSMVGYPAGNFWLDNTSGVASLFTDYANYNFKLLSTWRVTDTCVSIAGDCSGDGKDLGVDMVALLAAQSTSSSLFGARQAAIFRATTIH